MNQKVITSIDHRGIATVTLNRPEKHNALDDEMINELTAALKQIGATNTQQTDAKQPVGVMILAAEGNTFSAGADLQWMKRMGTFSYEENIRDADALTEMLDTLNQLPIPTIAQIQGPAFGGALGLISCCDIAIATTKSSFCFSEVKIGLIPATISPHVIKAIGERNARRYFLSAEMISASQAMNIGLIHEVVKNNQLDSTIQETVNGLLKNSPAAMNAAKQLVRDIAQHPIGDANISQETSKRLADIRLSEEGQEGLSAFLEKRKPRWQK